MRVLVWLVVAMLGIQPVMAEEAMAVRSEVAAVGADGSLTADAAAVPDGTVAQREAAAADEAAVQGTSATGMAATDVAMDAAAAAVAEEARVVDIEPAAGPVAAKGGTEVLKSADVSAYRSLFKDARAGKAPQASRVKDPVLLGHVKGVYLAHARGASFAELNGWLKDYRDLPQASAIYKLADAKRERPRQVCSTTKKKVPTKKKDKHGKPKTITKNVKSCKTVGNWGPAPVVPLAVELKEQKAAAREAERKASLDKLSVEGRRILGVSWRARIRGDYPAALNALLASGARAEAGAAGWQGELVKVASYYHGKRDWKNVLRAAEPAGGVAGPNRDDARWLAGFAHYRLGNVKEAAAQWQALVKDERLGGKHYARAAWWGARALRELRRESEARELLAYGAREKVSFYGQLCSARLGQAPGLTWGVPNLNDDEIASLRRVKAANRALALAQVGETSLAQQEFRQANDDLPYQASRALAVVAVNMGLPATALQSGKELLERGEVLAPALFPLPDQWAPRGGTWNFDRALMLGIMRQESAFQPEIGSWAGAQGLMQLMPATAAYVANMTGRSRPDRADLHDPTTNLSLAQDYLRYLAGKLDGNLLLVVAAYNGGIGNVQRWMDKGVTPSGDPVLWLESIPFDETRDYVEKVFGNYWIYQQRMGKKTWSLNALADGYWPLQWNAGVEEASPHG